MFESQLLLTIGPLRLLVQLRLDFHSHRGFSTVIERLLKRENHFNGN